MNFWSSFLTKWVEFFHLLGVEQCIKGKQEFLSNINKSYILIKYNNEKLKLILY